MEEGQNHTRFRSTLAQRANFHCPGEAHRGRTQPSPNPQQRTRMSYHAFFRFVSRPSAPSLRRGCIGIVLLATMITGPFAHAAVKLWTGAANGNFNNAGNWIGGTPVAGDDLIFQNTS